MRSCSGKWQRLALYAGGDLNLKKSQMIASHLEGCNACRSELAKFKIVISDARQVFEADNRLPMVVRNRIVREAALRACRPSWWLFPTWTLLPRVSLLRAAAVVLVALLVVPAVMREKLRRVGRNEISAIEVTESQGMVRLTWRDGARETHTVYKSSDPRTSARGQAHEVRGNSWSDRDPGAFPIVYYRVE